MVLSNQNKLKEPKSRAPTTIKTVAKLATTTTKKQISVSTSATTSKKRTPSLELSKNSSRGREMTDSIRLKKSESVEQEVKSDENFSPTSPVGETLGVIISTTDDELNKQVELKITESTSKSTSSLPEGWEQHEDDAGPYYWHIATGIIRRERPTSSSLPTHDSCVFYHDDDEINHVPDDGIYDEKTFLVCAMGSCDFDETQITSTTSSKAIQRCLLELSSMEIPSEDNFCWGLNRDQQIIMRFTDQSIDFIDFTTNETIHRQPTSAIKVWAVNDDNEFAFVVQEKRLMGDNNNDYDVRFYDFRDEDENIAPSTRCYVFRSVEDDDMCSKVASIMNEEMKRIKDSADTTAKRPINNPISYNLTDGIEEQPCDKTFIVKYLGRTTVPRPVGIDVLNNGIDICVMNSQCVDRSQQNVPQFATCGPQANGIQLQEMQLSNDDNDTSGDGESLIKKTNVECKIHVSPSSIIVESCSDGDVLVECRIRYLTFMGISKRNVKWYGFIMQVEDDEFQAHCFECNPSAGPVCQAIQKACTNMYQRVVQNDPDCRVVQHVNNQWESMLQGVSLKSALRKTFARITIGRG